MGLRSRKSDEAREAESELTLTPERFEYHRLDSDER